MEFKKQEITIERENGSTYTDTAVASFNNGFSHFIVDDHCYVLVNGNKWAYHLHPEAVEVLKKLPSNPDELTKEQ